MPVVPWKTYETPKPEIRYLALISCLPLKHFRAIPNFFRFAFEIQRQLRTSPGLIGYALEARPFSRKFWTLSAWRDEQSLEAFVGALPHSRVMKDLAPHMGKSQFAHWTVKSHEIPLDWAAAKARITQS